jgi:hypothetical protein
MYYPLWREDGFVVYNCRWPSPAYSFSGPSPAGLMTTFYCLSQIWDSPNLEPRSPYLYPPGKGWPNYNPRHWVPFYDSQGYGGGNSNPPPHPGGPVFYVLTHKFELDRIQNIAYQTFEAVICVLHWSKPVYQMYIFVSNLSFPWW